MNRFLSLPFSRVRRWGPQTEPLRRGIAGRTETIGDVTLDHDFGRVVGHAGAGQSCGNGQVLFCFAAIRVFMQMLQFQYCAGPCSFLFRPLPGCSWRLLAGFQPSWPCLEVVCVNVQRWHLGARNEICAQKEIINK